MIELKDYNKIADDIEAAAAGKAYYGNALYAALDIPELPPADKRELRRWLLAGINDVERKRIGHHGLSRVASNVRALGANEPHKVVNQTRVDIENDVIGVLLSFKNHRITFDEAVKVLTDGIHQAKG